MAVSKEFYEFISVLRNKVPIDRDNLEIECANQPLVYEEIGQEVVKASRRAKDAKADYDTQLGYTTLEIRKNPAAFGLDKVTEGTISAALAIDSKVKKAQVEMFDAEEEYKALQIIQESAQQRKSSIRDLVDMWVHNYYSSQGLGTPSSRVDQGNGLPNENADEALAEARKRRQEKKQEQEDKE